MNKDKRKSYLHSFNIIKKVTQSLVIIVLRYYFVLQLLFASELAGSLKSC